MADFERKTNNDNAEVNDLRRDLNRYTAAKDSGMKSEFMDNLAADFKFVRDENKMRLMVENILKEEFSNDVKNLKSYDLLVDAIIHKLKKDASGGIKDLENPD